MILGAGTALLGKEAAMACTVAVETSITEHYNDQLRELLEHEPEKYGELLEVIKKFRDDEQEHHNIGIQYDAEKVIKISFLIVSLTKFFKRHNFINH
jgi:ubiquinone biosynthesis monooxygenase Coq7